MKSIFRLYLIETFSLYLFSSVITGIVFENGIQTLLMAGVGLTIASSIAKPLINILLLPLNLLTFGLFRFVSSAIAIYLVTLVVPGFKFNGFFFSGYANQWFSLPAISLAGILGFIAFAFVFSIFTTFLHWLIK